jgi:hypothetical protein
MQYMLLIYGNESATHGMTEPQASERMAAYMAYGKAPLPFRAEGLGEVGQTESARRGGRRRAS